MGEKVAQALVGAFGRKKGGHLFRTVWPFILMDFYKTVGSAEPGIEVTEENFLDDRSGSIHLRGQKSGADAPAEPKVTAVSINGTQIWEDRS